MNRDNWHQEIIVTLNLENFLFSNLAEILLRLGYSTDESGEVFFYSRDDKVEQWQTDSLVTVTVYNSGKDIDYYDDEEQEITKVELGYLLPWQPIQNANKFISRAWELSKELNTSIKYENKEIKKEELKEIINNYAEDLEKRLEAPGGEFLAQAIEENLPL